MAWFKVNLKTVNISLLSTVLSSHTRSLSAAPRRSEAENFWNGFPDILVKGFLRSWMVRILTSSAIKQQHVNWLVVGRVGSPIVVVIISSRGVVKAKP